MQPSLQDLALGDKEAIPALAQGSQTLQGWQSSRRDEPGHICSPFQTPRCSLRAPFWGVCCLLLHWGCVWGSGWSSRGRQEAKLCHLLPMQSAGHCLPQETALLPGYIRGKTDTSGENYYPKVLRSLFLRKLLALARSPSDRSVSLKSGEAPAAGGGPQAGQVPRALQEQVRSESTAGRAGHSGTRSCQGAGRQQCQGHAADCSEGLHGGELAFPSSLTLHVIWLRTEHS